MSKYDGLGAHLRAAHMNEIPMTFSEIEKVVGTKLPPKAQHYRAWWSNNPSNNVMTKVWLDAGYETSQVDIHGRKLVFRQVANMKSKQGQRGMSDNSYSFKAAGASKKPPSHPLIGAMKGTFWIDPEWDLTKPTMSQDELDEMDANLDRTADLIESGMSHGKKR